MVIEKCDEKNCQNISRFPLIVNGVKVRLCKECLTKRFMRARERPISQSLERALAECAPWVAPANDNAQEDWITRQLRDPEFKKAFDEEKRIREEE